MDEVKKRIKECYLQLKREHGWFEDEMALNRKSTKTQNRNIKKGNKGKFSIGRCAHCGKYGHKKADCWNLKNKEENSQENERKISHISNDSSVKRWVTMPMNARVRKTHVGVKNMSPLQ